MIIGSVITEDMLTTWLDGQGVAVIEMDGIGRWGAYSRANRTVALHADLLPSHRVPVLMHECLHVSRDDDGHQDRRVEEWIDEEVAGRLVSLPAYAVAEECYGWNTGAIACELDLPRWVVQAYRRRLTRVVEGVLSA